MEASETTECTQYDALLEALEHDQFELYVQFIYDIHLDGFIGVEALSRWIHPERGTLLPSHYINDLHVSGLIERLDFCMLEKSCRLLEAWHSSSLKRLSLSCNFTRVTLSAPDFFPRFMDVVNRYSFDRQNLILEITEDSFFRDTEIARKNVAACREAGFHTALDDLGAGYTTFSDLCEYSVDLIKLDREITQKALTPRGRDFLREIVQLAHNLGIRVLCEGVETDEERAAVTELGCDFIQGFYYSRVVPVDEALRRLEADGKQQPDA